MEFLTSPNTACKQRESGLISNILIVLVMNNILKQRGSRNTSNVFVVQTTTTELIIKSCSLINKKKPRKYEAEVYTNW